MGRRGRVGGGSSSAKWTCSAFFSSSAVDTTGVASLLSTTGAMISFSSFTGAPSVEGGAGLGRGGYAGPFSFNIEGVLLGTVLVSITAVFRSSTGIFSSSGTVSSLSMT